ncbi:thiamine phosphate synthase [Aliarcobacter skirrowii]|uniref:thiamine phosphate synthase n=1 Tax=Aliarcobacter skirrowii TaxID=28200 RepID=UPI0021B2B96E|nr:thiamine phosphate synthase [Aliarcobacter skirrowii]MCT7446489.1 thiamine phosphate synthase [Aliarcobacter skirrowii]
MAIIVTNRKLCCDDFLRRVELLANSKPNAIILREKDLENCDYESLAIEIKKICQKYGVDFFVNSFIDVAIKLNIKNIQLSFDDFLNYQDKLNNFSNIYVSIHSLTEAKTAQNLGANAIIAGHIFETSCKEGLKPRGLAFLKELYENIDISIIAIGGINEKNFKDVLKNGAKDFCIMSEGMKTDNPESFCDKFKL